MPLRKSINFSSLASCRSCNTHAICQQHLGSNSERLLMIDMAANAMLIAASSCVKAKQLDPRSAAEIPRCLTSPCPTSSYKRSLTSQPSTKV